MERKQFLQQTALLTAFIGISKFTKANSKSNPIQPFVVGKGKSRKGRNQFFKGKHPNDVKISGKDTNQQLAVFEYIGYDKIGPLLHIHLEQEEIFFVAEGTYRFKVGDELKELGPGDTIFLPRNIAHTWIQTSDYGRLLYAVTPAGKLEDFFDTMENLKAPPTQAEVDKIHAEHGMKLVGPGLTL